MEATPYVCQKMEILYNYMTVSTYAEPINRINYKHTQAHKRMKAPNAMKWIKE